MSRIAVMAFLVGIVLLRISFDLGAIVVIHFSFFSCSLS